MSKFKIGDKVRVICNTSSEFDNVEIGDVGVIINIDNNENEEFPISLKIGKHDEYSFKEEELELITDDDFKLEMNNNNTYPIGDYPIGITPKDIWLKKRKQEILDAIIRYTEAEIMIPMEWAKELRELEERGV